MNLSDWAALIAILASSGNVLWSVYAGAKLQGADRQRLKNVEEELDGKVAKIEAENLERRVSDLENDMQKATDSIKELPVISERLYGLDRLITVQMDEMKHSMRHIQETIEARFKEPTTPVK